MSTPAGTNVLLLAGGRGTRLRTITGDHPKVLVPVHGRPFITHILDRIAAAGFRRAVLCTGWGAAEIRRTLGGSYDDMTLIHSVEEEPLGTAGALRHALDETDSDTVLVMNGDTLSDIDLAACLRWHIGTGQQASLVVSPVTGACRFGSVAFDPAGRVTSFREKATIPGTGYVNAGIYFFARRVIEKIPSGRMVSLEQEFLPTLIGEGLMACRCESTFLDIGTPEAFSLAPQFLTALAVSRSGERA